MSTRCPCGRKGRELTGRNPTDRGEAGSKYHLLCDTNGLPLYVLLSAANTHDSMLFEPLLDTNPSVRCRPGRATVSPRHLGEQQRTRLALPALLDTAAEPLKADLQRGLTSASSAAIRALTEIRTATCAGRSEQVSSTETAAADALRSVYARHLVLVAPPASQDEVRAPSLSCI